ncbi:MAG TPA: Calx-beta domain-containing protein [Thermoanaerobaculia bacterium]|nr:Calx-beta domain-containing protein [Thermoanaerobaculia bacterium]
MKSSALIFSIAVLLAAPPLLAQCQTYSGLTYGTYQDAAGQTQDLKLELLVPSTATPAAPVPAVVYIHGGGWFNGSRLPIPTGVSDLCSKGYAVASIDYRLSDTAIWPAQIQDSKGAVRWLRAHAATYNLDPDRFAAWGVSAGAQLASMLGTSGDEGTVTVGNFTADLEGATGGNTGFSSRVQAVVSWYGYGDMLQMNFYPSTQNHDTNGSPESRLVGDWIQKVPERTATANAGTFASPDDPPFLVMHGTIDDLVPFNQSELLVDALRRNGVRVTWVPVPNVGHGGTAFTTTANHQTVYDFLKAALLDLPATTVRVVAADASASEAASGAGTGTATFTVSRTGSTASPLTVRWAPGGTARIGTDYSLTAPWSVVIPAGAASANLTLTPVNDLLVEGDETAVIKLVSHPAYRIDDTGGSATAVLSDNDMAPGLPEVTIEAADPAASEVGPDGGSFTISVSPSPASDLLVRYEVTGTATNGEDFAALSGELTVPAGISSVDLDVTVLSDSRLEPSETVILSLSPGRFYEVGPQPTASVHILELDDESPMPVISVSAADPYVSEPGGDKGSFSITRTGSTASSLLIELVAGGSTQAGTDYFGLSSAVMFGKDVSRISIVVEAKDDMLAEGPETVTLAVAPGASFLLGPYASSTLTIADDESLGADGFYPLTPCRLVDTRGPAGPWGKPRLQAGEVRVFELGGRCGIPPDAIALSLNVTVASPDSPGFVTLFESGAPRPNAFMDTFGAGQTRGNNAIAKLTGFPPSLAVYCGAATGGLDLILDVNGYFR